MNINVKKIFMLVMVLGFAGVSFAPQKSKKAFPPQKASRRGSVAKPSESKPVFTPPALSREPKPRRMDFGKPKQVRRSE